MSGVIYLLQEGGELVPMAEEAYDSEDLLQRLLARYPDLMAGDQMDTAAPRRWLLVSRETGVPAQEGGGAQWSLDHLFLDQDAIPTLVEVKRSSDTRIRREVVGQMLDYAANAVVYWPIEKIRAEFEATCKGSNLDPEQVLASFLEDDSDQEEFWQKTKTNLQAGRVRMIFVADEIPSELRRVVEFLNSQMDPAEVLAVEIKQYTGQEMKTLVPRVIGLTAEAQQKKRPEGRQWDESMFFETLESKASADEVRVARRIFEWAQENKLRIAYGKGSQDGSLYLMIDHKGTSNYTVVLWTYRRVQTVFEAMKRNPPFDDEAKRVELLRRLNEIPGVALPDESVNRYPSIPMSVFQDEGALKQLLGVLDWIVEEVRSS
jgi:hypothetical protein